MECVERLHPPVGWCSVCRLEFANYCMFSEYQVHIERNLSFQKKKTSFLFWICEVRKKRYYRRIKSQFLNTWWFIERNKCTFICRQIWALHRLKFISFSLFYGSFEARSKKYQECRRLMLLLGKVPQTGQFEPSAKLSKALLLFRMSVRRPE